MSESNGTVQEGQKTKQSRFNWRGFFSLLLFGSFSLLAFSGIILYVTPKGRVANWTGWTLLGLQKEEWSSTHITLALLVLIASGFHLYYNWDIFWRYIKRRAEVAFNLKREMLLALLLCILTFFGTLYGIPPFSTLIQWNDDIKNCWEVHAAAPPMPHAEELTIEQLAVEVEMPLDEVIAALENAGYKVKDASVSVSSFANENQTTPNRIFAIIRSELRVRTGGSSGHGAGGGTGNGRGAGARAGSGQGQRDGGMSYGRMSLQQCCEQLAIPLSDAITSLKEAGIVAEPNEMLKVIADRNNKRPSEIAEIIQGK